MWGLEEDACDFVVFLLRENRLMVYSLHIRILSCDAVVSLRESLARMGAFKSHLSTRGHRCLCFQ